MELFLLFIPLALLAGFALDGGSNDDGKGDNGGDGGGDGGSQTEIDGTTSDPEVLRGTVGSDLIDGGAGNDLIFGDRGSDRILGGDGDDVLLGEGRNDTIEGGAGSDLILGGRDDDSLRGGDDDDLLIGGAGDDTLMGDAGDDVLIGSSGADQLFGGAGSDLLSGLDPREAFPIGQVVFLDRPDVDEILQDRFGTDARTEFGDRVDAGRLSADDNAAPDLLSGGGGRDFLLGDSGDTLTGGGGDDDFAAVFTPGAAPLTITDFDPLAETIQILSEGTGAGVLSIIDGTGGAEVRVDGEVVAFLQAVQASQIASGSVTVQRLA